MYKKLKKLINNSYSPISKFKVSSIVIDENNNEYSGVNVEYIIPTISTCAERNAISKSITNGSKFGTIKEVHILSINKDFVFPCGLCRQAIFESSNGKAKVFLYNQKGEVKEYLISKLLPHAFSKKDLKNV